jgi:hypothetical protein
VPCPSLTAGRRLPVVGGWKTTTTRRWRRRDKLPCSAVRRRVTIERQGLCRSRRARRALIGRSSTTFPLSGGHEAHHNQKYQWQYGVLLLFSVLHSALFQSGYGTVVQTDEANAACRKMNARGLLRHCCQILFCRTIQFM